MNTSEQPAKSAPAGPCDALAFENEMLTRALRQIDGIASDTMEMDGDARRAFRALAFIRALAAPHVRLGRG